MKPWMSHYNHKSISDAKFEVYSSSSLGEMTSQNFPRKKGMSHQIWPSTPGKRVQLKKMSFYVYNRSSLAKLTRPPPPSQFQQFSSREKFFHFQNFWDVSIRKAPATPDSSILLKSGRNKIKTKSHKVWAS